MGLKSNSAQLPRKIQAGLALLLEARLYAQDLAYDLWDLAVEISRLHAAGTNNSDLRWLIGRGYVDHVHEVILPGDDNRTFRRLGKLTFTERSCFVLTDAGFRIAAKVVQSKKSRAPGGNGHAAAGENVHTAPSGNGRPKACRPRWDPAQRTLYLGDRIVKRFSAPAPSQELVLAAFEELGWPKRIDDPFSCNGHEQSPHRLHSAISRLNGNRSSRLTLFRSDGAGRGIRWEPISEDPSAEA